MDNVTSNAAPSSQEKLLQNHEFKASVKEWIETDDKLYALQEQAKDLKDRKKELEQVVLGIMTQHGSESLDLSSGGSIKRSVSKTKSALKRQDLEKAVSSITTSVQEARLWTDKVYENRSVNERTYLKRNRPRTKKKST